MPEARLLALDLDGTLVRADGLVDERDARSIRAAVAAGVTVTIATGRLGGGALPTARALGLDVPVICADGGAVVCAKSGAVLERTPIACEVVESAVLVLRAHRIACFAFAAFEVHGEADGHEHAALLRAFSPEVQLHARLADAPDVRGGGALALLGIAERSRIEGAAASLDERLGSNVDVAAFALGRDGRWALRLTPRAATKGHALARLAARLGVARDRVAAVGDHYNDLSMFAWAGQSFAMGQSPDDVRAAASVTLEATAWTGGGVAEAIRRWLAA